MYKGQKHYWCVPFGHKRLCYECATARTFILNLLYCGTLKIRLLQCCPEKVKIKMFNNFIGNTCQLHSSRKNEYQNIVNSTTGMHFWNPVLSQVVNLPEFSALDTSIFITETWLKRLCKKWSIKKMAEEKVKN